MHVLVAPDKFKGSLSAKHVAARLGIGLRAVHPSIRIVAMPLADGGDGTVDAAVTAGFERVVVAATGPTGEPVLASYARRGIEAVVELASVCGLAKLPGGIPAPITASSYGLGQVVRAAALDGARRIVLGLGGSASTDGGAGFLEGLGAVLTDADGNHVPRGARRIGDISGIDLTAVVRPLLQAELVVASDVNSPLCGPLGAAAVYAPQKGASAHEVATLDRSLSRWADAVTGVTGHDLRDHPGAGAAGGVAFAAAAVLGATISSGIETMLDLVGFPALLPGCRLVITGEGSLDAQTLAGKAPAGVAAAARRATVPTVAVCGQLSLTASELAATGIDAAYCLTDLEPDIDICLREPGRLLEAVGAMIAARHLP